MYIYSFPKTRDENEWRVTQSLKHTSSLIIIFVVTSFCYFYPSTRAPSVMEREKRWREKSLTPRTPLLDYCLWELFTLSAFLREGEKWIASVINPIGPLACFWSLILFQKVSHFSNSLSLHRTFIKAKIMPASIQTCSYVISALRESDQWENSGKSLCKMRLW